MTEEYNGNPPWINYNDWLYFTKGIIMEDKDKTKVSVNTTIDYIPSFKGVMITEYIRPEILVQKKSIVKATGKELIDLSQVKDSELLELGLNSKGAMVANKGTEDANSFVIVALGLKVDNDEFKVGDRILLRHAAQPMGVEVGGKIYGQIHEYEIAGKFLN